ncbi:ribonuclease E/G [Acetivibrio saccincola]|uniref:ribonuclease E/G n=1 Tax=Acetivibrio saccincola TaxID=1677857 RepID=UPI002E262142|nr:ribonuclease E/G [Acetivibrio saccincola]
MDFIDMSVPEHKTEVMNVLEEALKKDRVKTTVVDMTKLGLIEMTRKNIREGFESLVTQPCPYCEGRGKILSSESVARNVEKKIRKYFAQTIASAIEVEVHPSVAEVLLGKNDGNLFRIENAFNKRIVIKASEDVKHEDIFIKEIDPDNLLT